MAGVIGLKQPVMMTGGVAKNRGVKKAVERILGYELFVSAHCMPTGAIDAALFAHELQE